MTVALDVDTAYTAFFDRQATDDEFRKRCHPRMSEVGWAAYEKYLHKHELAEHTPRERSGRIHATYLAGDVGFECDRSLFFEMILQDEEPQADVGTWKDLMRCFAIGHAMEKELYKWFGPALENYYQNDDFELLEVNYEWPMFKNSGEEFSDDSTLLVGTADVFFTYRRKGEEYRAVVDFKSTSKNRAAKRASATGVQSEPAYIRQVSSYLEPTRSDWGALVYWVKQWPHYFQQEVVNRRPGFYSASMRRLREVYADVEEGRPSPANPGSWCKTRCRFAGACQEINELQANGEL
jgi:hypothetical protein